MGTAHFGSIFYAIVLLIALSNGTPTRAPNQREFASPEDGVRALVIAARAADKTAMTRILGPDSEDIIFSSDDATDKAVVKAFLAAYDQHATLDKGDPSHATLTIGANSWRFPIPLVKGKNGWHFDTGAGKRQLFALRIKTSIDGDWMKRDLAPIQNDPSQTGPTKASTAPQE